MSSTRVMATCATLGQAVGTAAAIAARNGLSPREVYEQRIRELQQIPLDVVAHACRCVVDTAWGSDKVRLFAFDVSD